MALAYAMVIEIFVHRELKLGDFFTVVLEASKLGGSLFPVLAVALSLNIILIEHRIPQGMVGFMQGYIDSPLAFMLLVNVLLLIVGCLMTTGEAILVLAPLLAPVAAAYGYDKVIFGLIMTVNLEIGYLTPPVGLNLIVAMSAFKQPFGLLCRAAVPFILLMMACLALGCGSRGSRSFRHRQVLTIRPRASPADMVGALQLGMCAGGVGKREGLVHDGLDPAASSSGQTLSLSPCAIRPLAATLCGRNVEPVSVSRFTMTMPALSVAVAPPWIAMTTQRPSSFRRPMFLGR